MLRTEAPRTGLGAATRRFIDHVAGVADRYGLNLFTCFDDPRIPSTTNDLEGFFGASKRQLRQALGTGSTAGGVATNLGENYLMALAHVRNTRRSATLEDLARVTPAEYNRARRQVDHHERTATLRRSRRRWPEQHLADLLRQWEVKT